jgi:hypothetical protein
VPDSVPLAALPTEAKDFLAATKVFVIRTVKSGKTGESESCSEEQKIEVHRFVTPPAGVYVQDEIKRAKNYNSASYTVGVWRPCYVEEIDDARKWADDFVHTALSEQTPELIKLVDRLGEM